MTSRHRTYQTHFTERLLSEMTVPASSWASVTVQ